MKLLRRLLPIFCIILVLSPLFLETQEASAARLPRPLLSVWPPLSFHTVGTTFRVSINLTDVDSLVAYNLVLLYNTLILDATGATVNGTWIDTERPQGYEVEISEVNDGLGEINFQVFLVSGDPLTGSGVLLFVDFAVAVDGVTLLNLDENQDSLIDSNFLEVRHDTSDGVFTSLGPELQQPQPFLTYSPTVPSIGDYVFFDASASYSPNGALTLYSWDFGDGERLSTTEAFNYHVFHNQVGEPVSGNFIVSLEVTDIIGLTNTTSRLVTVAPLSAGRPPVARYFSTPSDPTVDEMTVFNASVSVDPDGGGVVAASWDFGDGATAGGIVVAHAYSTAGFFSLRLAVVDDEGQTGSLQVFIGVTKAEVQVLDTFAGARVLHLRDDSTLGLYASIINTGGHDVNAYMVVKVTSRRGSTFTFSTSVIRLDVRDETTLSMMFSPSITGRYRVSIAVFINLRSALLTDSRWLLGAGGEFNFNVVG